MNRHNARAPPESEAQHDRRDAVTDGLRLPYQERIRIKKIVQRKEMRLRKNTRRNVVIGTLNVGTMTGRGTEVVDMMKRKGMGVLCVQETRWKGKKAREMGNGYKMYYAGEDGKKNGVGIILSPKMKCNVLEVTRESDRVIWMRLNVDGRAVNVISAYAPQVGCNSQEKEDFWEQMEEVMQKIAENDVVWIGADFNGKVGEGNIGATEVMGKHGVGRRNEEGQMIVEFALANNMAIVNTYFEKRHSRKITYTSGDRNTQIDYILCRRGDMKMTQNCYVLPGEAVAKQHKVVVCKGVLETNGKMTSVKIRNTKWWRLNQVEHREKFVGTMREALQEEEKCTWEVVSDVMRKTAQQVLGVTSGKRGKKEETWWWKDEVQDPIKRKKEMKKERDQNRNEVTIRNYKVANKIAKRAVSKAKGEAYKDLYESLGEGEDGMRKAIRIAKQKNKDSQDVYQVRQIKGSDGTVLTEENEVRMRWGTYFEQLMNVENERVEREIEPGMESQVPPIEREEIVAAMKKMKRGKAVGPDDIPIEAWKVLGEAGVDMLLEILTGIMQSETMPEEWRDSILIPVFKNKGDILECGNYRGIKLMAHTLKLGERVIEKRLRERTTISDQQFGFMPGRSTTDAIFALRQLM